jgi:hypothetical protein
MDAVKITATCYSTPLVTKASATKLCDARIAGLKASLKSSKVTATVTRVVSSSKTASTLRQVKFSVKGLSK